MTARPAGLVLALALLAGRAAAQDRPPEGGTSPPDRPAESDLFGAPPAGQGEPAPPGARGPGPQERLFGRLRETENPLAIGGQLYLRAFAGAREGQAPSAWQLTAPSLVDGFLDARPSERVRGFLLARMFYDPTIDPNAPGPFGTPPPTNPQVLLDQVWIRFDAARTAFFTVGKQHVKWGTGRFWNPTDYLHDVRRDPLAVFDARTGTTMVRVDVPWERRGWNFYGMAILEPLRASADTGALAPVPAQGAAATTPSGTVGGVGGALRAEVVLGPSEIGAGAVLQRGHQPRFALDASAGIGELDVYGEAALETGSEVPLWRERATATASTPLLDRFETYDPAGLRPAVTVGLRWAHRYSDEDSFELGGEYFYNRNGYRDTSIYPWLIVNNAFTPFYVGLHYAGAYASLPNPGPWNHTTFVLSTLANLSDRSFITRLDHSVLLLTYLRLESFVQVHYGAPGGEFRLGISVPAQEVGGRTTPAVTVAPAVVDVGLAVRVSL